MVRYQTPPSTSITTPHEFQEAPDRWDTNPVSHDTDGDKLPDGWEVTYSEESLMLGLVDNNTLDALGARGPMDQECQTLT